MSKRANAFQRTSVDRAAGQIAPAASRTYKGASEYSFDTTLVRRSSFVLPVPQMFKPSEYLKDVDIDAVFRSYYGSEYRLFEHVKKYVDGTIRPWLDENNINKFRIYYLKEHAKFEGFDEVDKPSDMVYYHHGLVYLGAGIIFKNPDHRVLFKLTF